jgi:hypothetical protein
MCLVELHKLKYVEHIMPSYNRWEFDDIILKNIKVCVEQGHRFRPSWNKIIKKGLREYNDN